MRNLIRKTTILTICILFSLIRAFGQAPSADFTAATTTGCAPLAVSFHDQSTGNPSSWLWDFGNGSTSTLQNPSTTYFTPGIYTVKLTVTNAAGSNTLTRSQYITIYGKPKINFTVNDSVACFPHRAQFTDLSTPADGTTNNTWLWDFGDGTQSTEQNPLNVYKSAGNYSVVLKVTSDKGCYSVFSKPAYITVSNGVQASFTNSIPDVCKPPFSVTFTNNTSGPGTLTYLWDFGDGTTSTDPNPGHVYTNNGLYSVTLAATSSEGCSDTLLKANQLDLQQKVASINAPDSICVNAPVYFQNNSTPTPNGVLWDFGDGTTSKDTVVFKTYSTPNTYTVQLINKYGNCSDTGSKAIIVLPRPKADFTAANTTKCQPSLTVNFSDLSTNAVSWFWDFGDSTNSTEQNPAHTYSNYGEYNVQLVVTNLSGCTDTLIKKGFIKIERPVISFNSLPVRGCLPYSITPTASIKTLDAVTSYAWDFGDGSSSSAANPSYTYTQQGVYTISLTVTTSTGCTETYSLPNAVKVGTHPQVGFNAIPNPVCALAPVQFMDTSTAVPNGIDQWFWSFGDGAVSSQKNPVHQYADTGLFTIHFVVSNSGCADSVTLTNYIKVNPPIARFGYKNDCSNKLQFTFTDTSVAAQSWHWDFGDGTILNATDNKPVVHTFPDYGTYTVTLTVTNDTCSNSMTKVIHVVNEVPVFTASDTIACHTATIHFSVSNINSANIIRYNWDLGDGTKQTLSTPGINHTYTNSGTYTISLTATDLYGCTVTVPHTNYIRINGPVANFSGFNTDGCRGINTNFRDRSRTDGVHKITDYKWDFGDGSVQDFTQGPFQHTYDSAGTFTVKLIVTDASGCSDSISNVGMIHASSPKADFRADTLSCPGGTVHFSNSSSGVNLTSHWDLGNGNLSTASNPVNKYQDTGFYSIRLKVTDAYGCSDSLLRPDYIKIYKPVASFTVDDSASSCAPFEVHFTNTSYYYRSAIWSLGNGTSTKANPVQYYTVPGSYTAQLVVTSLGGCTDTARKTIRLYDTAGSKLTYLPLNGCQPLLVNLQAYSPGPVSYTWDFGDGILETNDSTHVDHTYHTIGDVVPKVIMTDPTGCIIPLPGSDTINIIGGKAKFGLDRKLLCDSGFVQFIDSTIYNDSIVSYHWNFGDGSTSGLHSPGHQYTSPGFYTISLDIRTQNNCVDTFSLANVLKIVESPSISITGDSVICINDFMQHHGVFNRPDTSVVQWQWAFPNGNTSTIQNPTLQHYTTAGNFMVSAVATNSSGCTDTAYKNIVVHPLPQITAPSTITMQAGFPVVIPALYSSNVTSFFWTPATTLSCSDCPQPMAAPKFNTIYTVAATDSNGCRNTASVQVVVFCKNANVFVPNTFSPNGDGLNDVFYVRGKGLDRVKQLRIFNRWGQIVFERADFPVNEAWAGWDGTFKGQRPQPGVYVYQIEVYCENGQVIHFEGNVALLQ